MKSKPMRLSSDLRFSLYDVMAFGIMIGLGESCLSAYAFHRGASARYLGFFAISGPFVGIFFQILCAHLLKYRLNRRQLYLTGAFIQAIMWLGITATLFLPSDLALICLLLITITYFSGGNFSAPAWHSTMGDLVPAEIRGKYFAKRNRFCLIFQCASTILVGLFLHWCANRGNTKIGFFVVFIGAAVTRFISVYFLALMKEPFYVRQQEEKYSLFRFLRNIPKSNFAKFTLFVTFISLSVHVSGPYFSLYMLRDLKMTYAEFMLAESLAVLGHVIALFTWGTLSDHFGNKKILGLCAVGITIIPLLWALSQNVSYIFFIQFLSGIWWSGFNLSVANFLLDCVSPEKRAYCVAYFNVLNGTGIFIGGILGICIVPHLPSHILSWKLFSPLLSIMILSGILRLVVVFLFLPSFKEVRNVPAISHLGLLFRATYLKSASDFAIDLLSTYLRGDKNREDRKIKK